MSNGESENKCAAFIIARSGNTLSVRLFRGERDITEEVPASALVWKRISRDPVLATGDAAWNASHAGAQVEITANEIAKLCRFECSYSETEGVFGSVNVDESLMAVHNPGVSDASDVLHLDDGMLVVSGSPRGGNADYYLEEGKLMVNPGFTGTITAVADFSPEAQRKVVSFYYDHNGLRTRKVVWDHGVTETYDYTLHGKLVTHMTKRREDEEGNVSSQELHFFYDSQSKPAFVEFEGERYRYIHSLQGDIIAIVDSAANTVVEYKYDAWGKPTAANSIENSIISDINPFRYRGYVFDDDINLYYLRSRYYHATLDRFINEDVYAGGQGRLLTHNMYAYCAGNPIMLQDPSGKKANYSLGDFFRTVGSMAKTFFNSLISTSKKAVNAFKNASSKYKKASGGRSLLLDIADQIPFDLNLKIDNFRITTKEVPNSIFYAALTTVSDYMGFPGVSSVVGDAVNSIPGVTGLGSAVDFSITWLSVRCGAWASAFEAGTHIQYGIEMDVVYPDASKIYLSFRFEEDDYFSGLNMTAACGNNMGIISVQNKTI